MKDAALVATVGVVAAVAAVIALAPGDAKPVQAALVVREAPKTTCAPGPAAVCDARDKALPKGANRYRRVELSTSTCTTTQK